LSGGGFGVLLVDSGHDGVENIFELLLSGFEFSSFSVGVLFDEFGGFIGFRFDALFFIFSELVLEFFISQSVSDGVGVIFESVLGFNFLSEGFIFVFELFGFFNEFLDVFLGKSSFVVGDSDFLGFSGLFVGGVDVHDSVFIDIEGDFDLRDSSRGRGDSVEVEFSQKVVVLGELSFSFEDLDEDSGLVVSIGGEDLGLFGGNGSVSLD